MDSRHMSQKVFLHFMSSHEFFTYSKQFSLVCTCVLLANAAKRHI